MMIDETKFKVSGEPDLNQLRYCYFKKIQDDCQKSKMATKYKDGCHCENKQSPTLIFRFKFEINLQFKKIKGGHENHENLKLINIFFTKKLFLGVFSAFYSQSSVADA